MPPTDQFVPSRIQQIKDAAKTQSNNMVSVISPDGTTGSIPAYNLEEAIKRGYKRAQ